MLERLSLQVSHPVMPGSGFLGMFDSCNLVSAGPDPIADIIPIPYSKQALSGYEIIRHALQIILKDIVQNRIVCLQRNLSGMIPNRRYDLTALSSEEAQLMAEIIDNFYKSHPSTNYQKKKSYFTSSRFNYKEGKDSLVS
jgi:hypothetical protein